LKPCGEWRTAQSAAGLDPKTFRNAAIARAMIMAVAALLKEKPNRPTRTSTKPSPYLPLRTFQQAREAIHAAATRKGQP